jgi:hypothetical protein
MAGPSVPLSTLVTRNVPYEWHDAVAVVAQFVEQLRSDVASPEKRIPDASGISLEQNGTLTIKLAPDSAMPVMPGAVQILQQLLGGRDQPTGLRLVLLKAAGDQPSPSLDAFAAELSRWERPNRQAKLAVLYQHAAVQLGSVPANTVAPPDSTSFSAAPSPASVPVAPVVASARPARNRPPASLTTRELAVLGGGAVAVIVSAVWIATGQPIPLLARRSESAAPARIETPVSTATESSPVTPVADGPGTAAAAAASEASVPSSTPESDIPSSRDAEGPRQQPAPASARPSNNEPPAVAAARRPTPAVPDTPPARPTRETARAAAPAVGAPEPTLQPPSSSAPAPRSAARTAPSTPRVLVEPPAITGTVGDLGVPTPVDVGTSSL